MNKYYIWNKKSNSLKFFHFTTKIFLFCKPFIFEKNNIIFKIKLFLYIIKK